MKYKYDISYYGQNSVKINNRRAYFLQEFWHFCPVFLWFYCNLLIKFVCQILSNAIFFKFITVGNFNNSCLDQSFQTTDTFRKNMRVTWKYAHNVVISPNINNNKKLYIVEDDEKKYNKRDKKRELWYKNEGVGNTLMTIFFYRGNDISFLFVF